MYEDGDHCIFYAVQEANLFFNHRPLTVEEREAFQKERTKRPKLLRALRRATNESSNWIQLSLQMVMSKLKEQGIVMDSILCGENTLEALKELNFINRQNIPINLATSDSQVEVPAVFLVDCAEEGATHVWFAESVQDYYTKKDMHMAENDTIILAAHLVKQE